MTLHGFPGEVVCRTFPLTLRGLSRTWFGSLAPGSIENFKELAHLFLTHFRVSRRRRCPTAFLLTTKQREQENLKTYLARFNTERMTAEDQEENINLPALLGGVWPRSTFRAELAKRISMTLREFMDQADN
ncbi:uncharacterized protein LOC122282333 [Carya illinoinensis]|uniref:uncharacterized protein LOC122282333 n=1 Tax=Carya illinoinensis TaxID=32201 RepID=UPI001C726366|nr:uncharacterized protein LOC122282333 [Carya illinoinensis]